MDSNGLVQATPDRTQYWEIQTPQIIRKEILEQGFSKINESQHAVTDDVSVVEYLGLPVQIVEGDYTNLKITTAEDLAFAKSIHGKKL